MKHYYKWYQRRLAKYFTENYDKYEDFAEFYNDPAYNQWLFYIPQLNKNIVLTCNNDGVVIESVYER